MVTCEQQTNLPPNHLFRLPLNSIHKCAEQQQHELLTFRGDVAPPIRRPVGHLHDHLPDVAVRLLGGLGPGHDVLGDLRARVQRCKRGPDGREKEIANRCKKSTQRDLHGKQEQCETTVREGQPSQQSNTQQRVAAVEVETTSEGVGGRHRP